MNRMSFDVREPLVLDGGRFDRDRLEVRNHGDAHPVLAIRVNGGAAEIVTGDGSAAPSTPIGGGGSGPAPEVFENCVELHAEGFGHADLVFAGGLHDIVEIDVNFTEVYDTFSGILDTPIVVEEGVNDTLTADVEGWGELTYTVPAGSYDRLYTSWNPFNGFDGGLLGELQLAIGHSWFSGSFSADPDVTTQTITAASTTGENITLKAAGGLLAELRFAPDTVLEAGGAAVTSAEFAVVMEPVQIGNVLVAWTPGASTDFGVFGPVVPVYPTSTDFGLVATPVTASITPAAGPGRYRFVATGGVAGRVSVIGGPALITGTVSVSAR